MILACPESHNLLVIPEDGASSAYAEATISTAAIAAFKTHYSSRNLPFQFVSIWLQTVQCKRRGSRGCQLGVTDCSVAAWTALAAEPAELPGEEMKPFHACLTSVARTPDSGEDAIPAIGKFLLIHDLYFQAGPVVTM